MIQIWFGGLLGLFVVFFVLECYVYYYLLCILFYCLHYVVSVLYLCIFYNFISCCLLHHFQGKKIIQFNSIRFFSILSMQTPRIPVMKISRFCLTYSFVGGWGWGTAERHYWCPLTKKNIKFQKSYLKDNATLQTKDENSNDYLISHRNSCSTLWLTFFELAQGR